MIPADKLTVVVGQPGTGKTSHLLQRVDDCLEDGILPDRIGYVSFTRRALDVMRGRMATVYNLGRKDLPHFRTLHALAYYLTGTSRGQVLSADDLAAFGDRCGLDLRAVDITEGRQAGDGDAKLVFRDHLARIGAECVDDTDADPQEARWFARVYREFKRDEDLRDFTDLLTMALEIEPPELDILLVDEAQDLSMLQWQLVAHLATRATRVVVAGDSNQAIYCWAGADPDTLVNLAGEVVVLAQGYRMTAPVHAVAAEVAARIVKQRQASFAPRPGIGLVEWCDDFDALDFDGQEWLVLARTNYLLARARAVLDPLVGKSVRFSTIHSAKGEEADRVLLFTDMTRRCMDNLTHRPDDEHRCWYVAVSRAKYGLYIANLGSRYAYDLGD